MARRTPYDASPYVPNSRAIGRLRAAAQACEGCDLYRSATQAVFGSGPSTATMMFVGEQPGNEEDLTGEPFVGPAGKLLSRALEAAGINREDVYVTNAVKHFKFERRGKRRLHQKPTIAEVAACFPWLAREIEVVRPEIILCLGATAARAVVGPSARVLRDRQKSFPHPSGAVVRLTVHPSALLRVPDSHQRHAAFAEFVRDLNGAYRLATKSQEPAAR